MTNLYQMRNEFSLQEYNTAITRADFEAYFTKTNESIRFTFNGWDGKSYNGESRNAKVYRTNLEGYLPPAFMSLARPPTKSHLRRSLRSNGMRAIPQRLLLPQATML